MGRSGTAYAAGMCAALVLASPALAGAAAPSPAPTVSPTGAAIAPAIPSLEFRRLVVSSDGAVVVQLACASGPGGCPAIGTLSAGRPGSEHHDDRGRDDANAVDQIE